MIREERLGAEHAVSLIVLDRPERRNALDPPHWNELARLVQQAAEDGARAVVLTGAGSAFCAGADLDGIKVKDMAEHVEAAFTAVRETPIPVIAYVNGPAVGAGVQLAVSCDLRVSSAEARFRIPAALISMPVHPGTIRRLIELAGRGPTRALLIGADWLDAQRAHNLGLTDRIGGHDEAVAWATEIAGYAPLALRYFKEQLQLPNPADDEGYVAVLDSILASDDYAEAVRARQESRPPVYRGR